MHRLNCLVVYIAERNRLSMGSGGLSSGAGSRKIVYGAESVISLNRDRDAKPELVSSSPITVKLAKNHHGTLGKQIYLPFNGALQRFNLA